MTCLLYMFCIVWPMALYSMCCPWSYCGAMNRERVAAVTTATTTQHLCVILYVMSIVSVLSCPMYTQSIFYTKGMIYAEYITRWHINYILLIIHANFYSYSIEVDFNRARDYAWHVVFCDAIVNWINYDGFAEGFCDLMIIVEQQG